MPVYDFEDIGSELDRPPFAALRALQAVGVLVTPRGWQQLDHEARRVLVEEGSRERVDLLAVRTIANGIAANQIKLVSRSVDPSRDELSAELSKALGPQRAIPLQEWQGLTSLDRFMLASLSYNTRLLWRALDELERAGKLERRRRGAWSGAVARCELVTRADVLVQFLDARFLEGRGPLLARGAGRRAARRASEIFDLQVDTEVGPIELDWGLLEQPGSMVWQAHVSGWDGSFLPAASLQAAVTAAVAVHDMIKELDPRSSISLATIAEEPWLVGGDAPADLATRLFNRPVKSMVDAARAAAAARTAAEAKPAFGPNQTQVLTGDAGSSVRAAIAAAPPPASAEVPAARPSSARGHEAAPATSASRPSRGERKGVHMEPVSAEAAAAAEAKHARENEANAAQSAMARMDIVAAATRKPKPGTTDLTVVAPQRLGNRQPLLAVLIVIGLIGAGLLGYAAGR